MSFESELVSLFTANAPLVAIVGDDIVPVHDKDGGKQKFLVYQRTFSEPRNSLDGNTSNAQRVRLQVDCYSEDFDEAIAIAAAAKAAIPATGANGASLHGLCINEFDSGLEEQTRLYRRVIEFSMFYHP